MSFRERGMLTSVRMSWRNRKGGFPSSFSVRGGRFINLPSVSRVFSLIFGSIRVNRAPVFPVGMMICLRACVLRLLYGSPSSVATKLSSLSSSPYLDVSRTLRSVFVMEAETEQVRCFRMRRKRTQAVFSRLRREERSR